MGRTESRLKTLFDLQRFEENSDLKSVIEDTLKKSSGIQMLSDDVLEFAAGGVGGEGGQNNRNGTNGSKQMHCPECNEDVDINVFSGTRAYCSKCGQYLGDI